MDHESALVDFAVFLAAGSERHAANLNFLLRICGASIATAHPGATLYVLTDETTPIEAPNVIVRRRPLNRGELMLERARWYRAFIASGDFRRPTAFIDYDVVLNRSLASVFDGSFDVAVTYRPDNVEEPINGGVILLSPERQGAALRFYDRLLAAFENIEDQELRRWFGDQLALASAVTPLPDPLEPGVVESTHGVRVSLLRARDYNYTYMEGVPYPQLPESLSGELFVELRAKPLVHFKGPRKRLMAAYWRACRSETPRRQIKAS